jgi:RNA polymerase sigma factor (sigma-70 family)
MNKKPAEKTTDGTTKKVADILQQLETASDPRSLILQAVADRVRRWAKYVLKGNSLQLFLSADDLEQTVMRRILEVDDFKKFNGDGRQFMAFLWRVVLNVVIDKSRKQQRSPTPFPSDPNSVPDRDSNAEMFERLRMISEAALSLPDEFREAIELIYGEENLSRKQAATQVGLTPKQFTLRLTKAIKQLTAIVDKQSE